MNENQANSQIEDEALKFLDRDFNQCFQQMRHYDAQIFDILKFMFTAYSVLIGVAIGLYQFGVEKSRDFVVPITAVLTVALIMGIFMLALTVRNRAYYVQVARYINEQRWFFLDKIPLGFQNKSKMYANHNEPPFFNWRSSHSWLHYVMATLNAILLAIILGIAFSGSWVLMIVSSMTLFIVQLLIVVRYLITRERKTASEAVFGK